MSRALPFLLIAFSDICIQYFKVASFYRLTLDKWWTQVWCTPCVCIYYHWEHLQTWSAQGILFCVQAKASPKYCLVILSIACSCKTNAVCWRHFKTLLPSHCSPNQANIFVNIYKYLCIWCMCALPFCRASSHFWRPDLAADAMAAMSVALPVGMCAWMNSVMYTKKGPPRPRQYRPTFRKFTNHSWATLAKSYLPYVNTELGKHGQICLVWRVCFAGPLADDISEGGNCRPTAKFGSWTHVPLVAWRETD